MVRRITAVAELDDRPTAAAATRERAAAGDGDNAWLLEQWDAGRLLLAEIIVSVAADNVVVRRAIDGVWLELDEPPRVEEQVAGVAPAELAEMAFELRGLGIDVEEAELQASYLHVELGERLRAALT